LSGKDFECPACGWKGHPVFDLNAKGKLVGCCQGKDCGYQDANIKPLDFGSTVVALDPSNPRAMTVLDVTPAASSVAAAPVPTSAPASFAKVTGPHRPPVADPYDPIPAIKARRDFLEAEIARLEGFRIEKRKLDKMLAAARREEARIEAASLTIPAAPGETN
jgi:hypothetical protein